MLVVGYMVAIKLAVALLHRLRTGVWPPCLLLLDLLGMSVASSFFSRSKEERL
jgi:hypothetical protein